METRRSVLVGGVCTTGLLGTWGLLSTGDGSGSGSRSTDDADATDDADFHCSATARRHPRTDRFSIDTVTSRPGSTTVHYRIRDTEAVAAIVIVAEGSVVRRTSTVSIGRNQLSFDRDGPATFEIRLHGEDGSTLDAARIHAACTS